MKILIPAFLLLAVSCSTQEPGNDQPATPDAFFAGGTWLDMTYSFSASTLYWPNNKIGFELDTMSHGISPGGYFYASNQFCAPEHGGTHLDAPIHFAENGFTSDQIPLTSLMGSAVVVDVSANAAQNRDYLAGVADFEAWEAGNGQIPDNAVVLIRTGYGKFYPDPLTYFGTDKKGEEAVADLHFPGLDPAAAEWMVANRKIKAVGLDTPSIDYGQSTDFKSHQILLGKNIPVFENVARLDQLPVKGSFVIALPMKIEGGSGGPLRLIAWVAN
ncbi:MAG TPA: cyclase family protein [Flavilitoribacter sp.]|nr:cyclase family protein [Flavilitoribacter sp.]HMQ86203.1 cyclase family protein [Flavilitoribacter sp.]